MFNVWDRSMGMTFVMVGGILLTLGISGIVYSLIVGNGYIWQPKENSCHGNAGCLQYFDSISTNIRLTLMVPLIAGIGGVGFGSYIVRRANKALRSEV